MRDRQQGLHLNLVQWPPCVTKRQVEYKLIRKKTKQNNVFQNEATKGERVIQITKTKYNFI